MVREVLLVSSSLTGEKLGLGQIGCLPKLTQLFTNRAEHGRFKPQFEGLSRGLGVQEALRI